MFGLTHLATTPAGLDHRSLALLDQPAAFSTGGKADRLLEILHLPAKLGRKLLPVLGEVGFLPAPLGTRPGHRGTDVGLAPLEAPLLHRVGDLLAFPGEVKILEPVLEGEDAHIRILNPVAVLQGRDAVLDGPPLFHPGALHAKLFGCLTQTEFGLASLPVTLRQFQSARFLVIRGSAQLIHQLKPLETRLAHVGRPGVRGGQGLGLDDFTDLPLAQPTGQHFAGANSRLGSPVGVHPQPSSPIAPHLG